MDVHILCCSNHASVSVLAPVLDLVLMYSWQFALTLPEGPQSWTLMTMRPTVQSTKRMKEPIMTMPGSSCRWEMSQSMAMMKTTEREPTVTQYGKYLTCHH
jgi:hypothetical protein